MLAITLRIGGHIAALVRSLFTSARRHRRNRDQRRRHLRDDPAEEHLRIPDDWHC